MALCHSFQHMLPRPPVSSTACQDMSFFMHWVIRTPNRSCMVMAFSVVSVIMPPHPFNITSVDSNASVILQKSTPLSTDADKQESKLRYPVVNQEKGQNQYGRYIEIMTYCEPFLQAALSKQQLRLMVASTHAIACKTNLWSLIALCYIVRRMWEWTLPFRIWYSLIHLRNKCKWQ